LLRTTEHLDSQVKRYAAKATIFEGRLKRVVHHVKKNKFPFFPDNVLDHPFRSEDVHPEDPEDRKVGEEKKTKPEIFFPEFFSPKFRAKDVGAENNPT
jgi:hypothetical protein